MNISWLLFLITFGFIEVYSWRFFHHGRMVGGNLGKPINTRLDFTYDSVQEKLFTQTLDHFNPNNENTWQQVSVNKK